MILSLSQQKNRENLNRATKRCESTKTSCTNEENKRVSLYRATKSECECVCGGGNHENAHGNSNLWCKNRENHKTTCKNTKTSVFPNPSQSHHLLEPNWVTLACTEMTQCIDHSTKDSHNTKHNVNPRESRDSVLPGDSRET